MTVDFLTIRLDETDPQGWRERWQQAQQQGDDRSTGELLLTEMGNRATREAGDERGE